MKDGRIITKEDKVVGAQYLANGFTKFGNVEGFARICNKNGDIILDFNEMALYEKTVVLTDIILTVDEENRFKVRDFEGNILYARDNILDFDPTRENIILTEMYEDGHKLKVAIDYDYKDTLTSSDGLINCKVSPAGDVFSMFQSGEAYLSDGNKMFDHGYKHLLDVVFLNNSMFITGMDYKRKITTLIIHNN